MTAVSSGYIPAACRRVYATGERVLTPLCIAADGDRPVGWLGELVVGTIITASEEYDLAPGADALSQWHLIVEAQVPGRDKPSRLERTGGTVIPWPVAA